MTRHSPIINVRAEAQDVIATATARHLPLEIGGILLGYREDGNVIVTNALVIESPTGTPSRYIRDGVLANARLASFLSSRATNDPVGYIGEWHSHPVPSNPSSTDGAAIRAAAKAGGEPLALLIYAPGDVGGFCGLITDNRRLGRVVSRAASVVVPPPHFTPLGQLPTGAVSGDGPIFISYRQWDGSGHADSLENLLRAAGLVVWRDHTDLRAGTTTDRLEHALTTGLSAGVLIVTPDIANSEIVRERELPRLLDLDVDPDFSLCIANAVARLNDDSVCDYGAPDRLLRLAPKRVLADKKQANLLEPSGELEIVRDLLMQRIEQRKAAIHREGRDFTIDVQSRPDPFAIDADDTDLQIRIKRAGEGRLPSPDGLRNLQRTLPLTSDAVYAAAPRGLRISGGGHLSVGLALGAAFPETKFGNVTVLNGGNAVWKSRVTDHDPRITMLMSDDILPGRNLNTDGQERVAILITLTASPDLSAFQKLVEDAPNGYSVARIISVKTAQRIDPREAGRLSIELGEHIKALSARYGRAEVHLAFHGPFAMAVLIGRYLNTLRTVVYEWDLNSPSRPVYRPVVALEPGRVSGPITDVFE